MAPSKSRFEIKSLNLETTIANFLPLAINCPSVVFTIFSFPFLL